MRVMFQPDTLHNQAPSDHTRHHHAPHRAPEKTSGFNIPNAPTTSLHQQPTTTRPQLSVKLSLLPSRHDTASPPFPTQTSCSPSFTHLPPTLHTFAPLNPQPRARIRMPALTHPPARHPIQRHNEYKPLSPFLPRHISPSPHLSLPHLSLPHLSLPHLSLPHLSRPHPSRPHPSRPKPSTAASMRSHIGPRPTQTRRFLHMPPTRPH